VTAIKRVEKCTDPGVGPFTDLCRFEFVCSACGELTHIGEEERSPGWDVPSEVLNLAMYGDPPVCTNCRLAADERHYVHDVYEMNRRERRARRRRRPE